MFKGAISVQILHQDSASASAGVQDGTHNAGTGDRSAERPLDEVKLLGWENRFEKLNTQMTCEFMVTFMLRGGQF